MGFLSPKATQKLFELAENPYRPPEYIALKERIEAETRVAELRASITGKVDDAKIAEIVQMKLELDNLAVRWAEGSL